MRFFALTSVLMALLVSGCSTVPASGPQGIDVEKQSEGGVPVKFLPYASVDVTPSVVKILGEYTPRLSNAFANKTPPKAFRFGVGDMVSVTIFEAAAGGLFTSETGVRAGNFVTIPNQAVDQNGNITVPYAGALLRKDVRPQKSEPPSSIA